MGIICQIVLRKTMLGLTVCAILIFLLSQSAFAVDNSTLTWNTFIPIDGTRINFSTVDITVDVTDWDSLTPGTLKMFIDGIQVPASVTLSSAWAGGG